MYNVFASIIQPTCNDIYIHEVFTNDASNTHAHPSSLPAGAGVTVSPPRRPWGRWTPCRPRWSSCPRGPACAWWPFETSKETLGSASSTCVCPFALSQYLTWPRTCRTSTGLHDHNLPRLPPNPLALSEAEPRTTIINMNNKQYQSMRIA